MSEEVNDSILLALDRWAKEYNEKWEAEEKAITRQKARDLKPYTDWLTSDGDYAMPKKGKSGTWVKG
mgnify:FL=1